MCFFFSFFFVLCLFISFFFQWTMYSYIYLYYYIQYTGPCYLYCSLCNLSSYKNTKISQQINKEWTRRAKWGIELSSWHRRIKQEKKNKYNEKIEKVTHTQYALVKHILDSKRTLSCDDSVECLFALFDRERQRKKNQWRKENNKISTNKKVVVF